MGCRIPCADGVELAGDLELPDGGGARPAVVSVMPYHKDGLGGIAARRAQRAFAAAGFPALLVDVRGTGASDGLPRPPFDPAEADDCAAIVEWAARQPWCDGRVGMWGLSYGAVAAFATAARGTPALKAIIGVMGFLDPERDFIHPGGMRGCLASLGVWGLGTLAQHFAPPLDHGDLTRWQQRIEHSEPYLLDMIRSGPGDPSWRPRAVDASRIQVPSFCVAGWRDLHCDATLRAYERIRAPKQLLVGPWTHALPDDDEAEPVGFLAMAVDWWRRWLDEDRTAGGRSAVSLFVEGAGWRQLDEWPLETEVAELACTAGGDLGHDGGDFVTLGAGAPATVGVCAGALGIPTRATPRDRSSAHDDARSVTFTSEPMPESFVLCGRAEVVLGSAGTPTVARLSEIAPDGTTRLVGHGRGSGPVVTLTPTGHRVGQGSRLRLALAGADFPRLWPRAEASLRVAAGPGGAVLRLPVVPDDGVETEAPPRPGPVDAELLVLRADPLFATSLGEQASVTVGEHVLARLPNHAGTIDSNGYVTAAVADEHPLGARLAGKATMHIRTGGRSVVVRVAMELFADGGTVEGETSCDGEVVGRRRWRL